MKPHVAAGTVLFGGASLSEPHDPTSTSPPSSNGSIMLLRLGSEAEVREWLANDTYTKEGVWDVARAEIKPVSAAF